MVEGHIEYIKQMNRIEPENTEYLYWSCMTTALLLGGYFKIIIGREVLRVGKKKFMCGWDYKTFCEILYL
jgi:hypothetical protein